jgi:hypothetical protein
LIPFIGYKNMIAQYSYGEIVPEIQKLSSEELVKLYEAGKLPEWVIEQSLPTDYIENPYTEIVFRIAGYPIPHGTKAWLLIAQSDMSEIPDKVKVFKTKANLAQSFIENGYHEVFKEALDQFLNVIYGEGDLRSVDVDDSREEGIEKILASKRWQDWIQSSTALPYPLTPQSVYRYILDNDELRIHQDSDEYWWLFREVTF